MKTDCVQRDYCVSLEGDEEERLFRDLTQSEFADAYSNTLSDELEKMDGVSKAEYNSHFGYNFFYSLDAEYDNAQYRRQIESLIRRRLICPTTTDPTTTKGAD